MYYVLQLFPKVDNYLKVSILDKNTNKMYMSSAFAFKHYYANRRYDIICSEGATFDIIDGGLVLPNILPTSHMVVLIITKDLNEFVDYLDTYESIKIL